MPHPYRTDTWVVLREEILRAAYLVQTLNPISQVEAEKQMAAGLAEITDQSPLATPNLIGAIPLPANARFWQWENGFPVFGLNEEEAIKVPAYSSLSARPTRAIPLFEDLTDYTVALQQLSQVAGNTVASDPATSPQKRIEVCSTTGYSLRIEQ